MVLVSLLCASATAACGLLSACSHGSHRGSGTQRLRTAQAGRPGSALTRARAQDFAHAVNLAPRDLPGFRPYAQPRTETAAERRLRGQLRRCAGRVGPDEQLLAEQSRSYELRRDLLDLSVSSEVGVARTPALAARELAALRSGHVRACFARYLQLLLTATRHGGAVLGQVSIAAGTPPAPGATGSFGWRITAPFNFNRLRLSLYVDILGFVLGPARVTLVSFGAVRPFPAVVQQRLYSLLLERAHARAL